MSGILDGKVALILCEGGEVGVALALGLADQGASVGMVVPANSSLAISGPVAMAAVAEFDDRASVERGVAEIAKELGPVHLVVIPVVDPGNLEPASLASLDEFQWIARCEAPLRAARIGLQAGFGALRGWGGQIVVLVPTISVTGSDGFVPYAAVGEGVRSMAKAVARRWGAQKISVNCIALLPAQLCPGKAGTTPPPQAFGRTPDLRNEVAPFIALLATTQGRCATGSTIALDGGHLMLA